MREVDLELDYCPKCEPEETQDPFPTQSFKFFYMFSVAVKCVNCGTYYVPSPRLGVIVTIIYFLGVWINEYLAGITAYPFSSILSLCHWLCCLRCMDSVEFSFAASEHGVRFPETSRWNSRNICCPRSSGPCSRRWGCLF